MDRAFENRPYKALEILCGWKFDVQTLVVPILEQAQQQVWNLINSEKHGKLDNFVVVAKSGWYTRAIRSPCLAIDLFIDFLVSHLEQFGNHCSSNVHIIHETDSAVGVGTLLTGYLHPVGADSLTNAECHRQFYHKTS